MYTARLTSVALAFGWLFGCAEEPPPPSVDEFMNNSVLLDATMVRCSANRSTTKYEVECVNARDAINRIARVEEEARRAELESQSERKRRALRRTQEAATLARRRAAEAARIREEQAYLAQFDGGNPVANPGAAPIGTTAPPNPLPAPGNEQPGEPTAIPQQTEPAPAEPEPAPEEPTDATDLQSIREELKRRQQ